MANTAKTESSENPNAFKHFVNAETVKKIVSEIRAIDPELNLKPLERVAQDLAPLELKQRVLLITQALIQVLPNDFNVSAKLLIRVIRRNQLKGFELWPFSEFIGQRGLMHFDLAMKAMYEMTSRFTSEFAIRPYFNHDHKQVLKFFKKYSKDKNHHVRRWVSEGSRPLLPWGQRIASFVQDPTHTIPLLETLKYDDELYVRKSVANHLNDISKHHPKVVIALLRKWNQESPQRHQDKVIWITKHGLRTLIKKGDPAALKLLGVGEKPKVKRTKLRLSSKTIRVPNSLEFSFEMVSTSNKEQRIAIDYKICFQSASGRRSEKVFKLKTLVLLPHETVTITKKHSFRPITTRKYYSGPHEISLQLNGQLLLPTQFLLQAD